MENVFIHPTAEVADDTQIGAGTRIWNQAQVRAGARIGEDCNLGKGVYIACGVSIGNRVKIQNHASLFEGVTLQDGVFVGPHVCFTNDLLPRAITLDGRLKGPADWEITPTLVKYGASLGAGSIILCGTTIGLFAMVGAGSVVTRSVPDFALVYGNPARIHGYVCQCGQPLTEVIPTEASMTGRCQHCNKTVTSKGEHILL